MNAPLVSICIPTYNRTRFVTEAVKSCLAQTHSNIEIIVTDNSPLDVFTQTFKALKELNDERIYHFHNGGDVGATESTTRGVNVARGKFIKILMDDDLLKPRCIERCVEVLEQHKSCDVVCAPMDIVNDAGERITPRFYLFRKTPYRYRYQPFDCLSSGATILREFLTTDYPCCVVSGVLFRANALHDAMPFGDYGFATDLDLMMCLAEDGDFYYIDEVLSSWRLTSECHTARLHRDGADITMYYKIARAALERTCWSHLHKDAMFFCSARAALNFIPALKQMSVKLFLDTLCVIWREDGYVGNMIKLPFFLAWQIVKPLFQRSKPKPRQNE